MLHYIKNSSVGSSLFSFLFVLTVLIGCNNDIKSEIIKQIETTYFKFGNGSLMSSSEVPLYDTGEQLREDLIKGANEALNNEVFVVEARGIEILDLNQTTADVQFSLFLQTDSQQKEIPVQMTMKKIGGKWKLDGRKSFPFDF